MTGWLWLPCIAACDRLNAWRARFAKSSASNKDFDSKYGVEKWLKELRATPEQGPRHAKPKGAS